MNLIKRKVSSFLTEVARKEIEALDPESPCAKELSKIEADDIIAEDIKKMCNVATLAETTRALLLVTRLKKASGQEKEAIKSNLNTIAERLVTRVEAESGRLRLPKACHHLLLEL